jgi:hypothetical protein
MSKKDVAEPFIQKIICDIKKMKELNDTEKADLISIVMEAWDSEQE